MKTKKIKYVFVAAATLVLLAACQKKEFNGGGGENQAPVREMTFSAGFDVETKTALQDGGLIYWSPNDSIKIGEVDANGRISGYGDIFISGTAAECASTRFSGTITSHSEMPTKWIAIYPAYSWFDGYVACFDLPKSQQTSKAGTFSPNNFPAAAVTETDQLKFKNLCGGFKITVSRKGIRKIVLTPNCDTVGFIGGCQLWTGTYRKGIPFLDGFDVEYHKYKTTSITLTVEGGGEFEPGKAYYATAIPQHVAGGVTIDYFTSDSLYRFISEKEFDIVRSKFGVLDKLDAKAEPTLLLSASNSHIISRAGAYSFFAFKGNTTESVGDVKSVKVLWESYGTSTAPKVGAIISSVSYSNGKITCTVTDRKGNAVIAAYDGVNGTGNILWSWHIWCTDYPAEQVYNNGAGTMMDRNIGATSAGDVGALGLLYQWGRKDPFLGSSSITGEVQAASTIKWPSPQSVSYCMSKNTTLTYSICHPTTFIYNNNSPLDWYCNNSSDRNDALWSADYKTVYDPCPVGWRVPKGGYNGIWATAFGSMQSWETSTNWNDTFKGMDFSGTDKILSSVGHVWYPAAGLLYSYNNKNFTAGNIYDVGYSGHYWSATTYTSTSNDLYYSYVLKFIGTGDVRPASAVVRASGLSVRCVKE